MSRRTRWLGGVAAVVVAAGLFSAVAGDGPPPPPGALTDATRYDAVTQVLAERTQAIVQRNRAEWLAAVDPRATQFRAEQDLVFDNLMRLPLNRFGFQPIPTVIPVDGLTERYGAPAFTVAAILRYSYDGVDAGPVARPMALTFVLRNDRWRLASDGDADGQLPQGALAEPWLHVPVEAHRSGAVLVITDLGAADADRIVAAAQSAAAAIPASVATNWNGQLTVYATTDVRSLLTYLDPARGQRLEWTRALAVPTFADVRDWVIPRVPESTPTGSRVILNPQSLRADDPDFTRVLTHEATHAATQSAVRPGAPTWMVEGFAEWVAYRDDPASRPADADLRVALADPAYPAGLPADGRFFLGNQTLNYSLSWAACEYIAETYGPQRLGQLFQRLASIEDVETAGPPEKQAFQDVLGVPESSVVDGLRAWLRTAAPAR